MNLVKYIIVGAFLAMVSAASAHQIQTASSPARSSNIYLDPNNPINGRSVMNFKLKAEGQNLNVQSLTVTVWSSLSPTAVSVWSGSTQLGSSAVTAVNSPISVNAPVTVLQDTAIDLVVRVDIPAAVNGNHWLYLELNNVVHTAGEVLPLAQFTGPTFYAYSTAVANFSLTGLPSVVTTTSPSTGMTSTVTATFPLRIRATGGNITKPSSQSVKVVAVKPPFKTLLAQSVAVSVIPDADIAAGAQATMSVTAVFNASDFSESGLYGFQISQINWASVYQTWGLEDFKAPNMVTVLVPQTTPTAVVRVPLIGDTLYGAIDYWSEHVNGLKGIVAGEGQTVSKNMTSSQIHYFVFPVESSAEKGNRFKVSMGQSAVSMSPIVYGPSVVTGNPFLGNLVTYTPTNIVQTVLGGVTTDITFDVTFGTLVVHVHVERTGDFSHQITTYWGDGSTATSPGSSLDLLNFSGTISGMPQRFQFTCKPATLNMNNYSLVVTALPLSFTIEQSENLKDWSIVGYTTSDIPPNADGSQTRTLFINRTAGYDPSRLFFRAVLNQ